MSVIRNAVGVVVGAIVAGVAIALLFDKNGDTTITADAGVTRKAAVSKPEERKPIERKMVIIENTPKILEIAPGTSGPLRMPWSAPSDGERIVKKYGRLTQNVGLSSEQRERLFAILGQLSEVVKTIHADANNARHDPESDQYRARRLRAQHDAEDKIQLELGSGVLQQYRAYEWTLSASELASTVAKSLATTPHPIDAAQQQYLAELLAPGLHASLQPPGGPVAYRITVDESLISRARVVLSEAQTRPLINIMAAQRARGIKKG